MLTHSRSSGLLALCLGTGLAVLAPMVALGMGAVSAAGQYTVEIEMVEPPAINVMRTWTIVLLDAQGAPVEHARIGVTGGMPGHGHGLPTAPEVTEEFGMGRYRLDGVKFNMTGRWVVDFDISSPIGDDTARLELDL
jgi:hypothetical protein